MKVCFEFYRIGLHMTAVCLVSSFSSLLIIVLEMAFTKQLSTGCPFSLYSLMEYIIMIWNYDGESFYNCLHNSRFPFGYFVIISDQPVKTSS